VRAPRTVELGEDPDRNRIDLQTALNGGPGKTHLPAGSWPVSGGLLLPAGHKLEGTLGEDGSLITRLRATSVFDEPLIHIVGSGTALRNLILEVPTGRPGEHDGDRGTAVTIGHYLYPGSVSWIENVSLEYLTVERADIAATGTGDPANTVAIMGAVSNITVEDVRITGGGTGLAVHWGAVATSVSEITGPSFHPHHIVVRRLHVAQAFEGFYLSSVHNVSVREAQLQDVEIGFRLLAGDNTARFAPADQLSPVSSGIVVEDCSVAWRGSLYAVRIAGWGRSEVDGQVTSLPYQDAFVRRCAITTLSAAANPTRRPRVGIVLEQARGIVLEDFAFYGDPSVDLLRRDESVVVRMTALAVDD
jgi:hypothetical protein